MIIMQVSTCKYGIYHTIAYLCCQYFFHFFIFGSNIKDAIYPKIKAADLDILFVDMLTYATSATFGAIVRAPITGVILISEMTGTFSNLLPLTMVVLVAYMTADVLKGGPLYEQLTDRLISGGKADYSNQKHKVLIESRVHLGSAMDERPLSEIDLPEGCLVVSVSRGHREVVPHGGTVIKAGDKLVVSVFHGPQDHWLLHAVDEDAAHQTAIGFVRLLLLLCTGQGVNLLHGDALDAVRFLCHAIPPSFVDKCVSP